MEDDGSDGEGSASSRAKIGTWRYRAARLSSQAASSTKCQGEALLIIARRSIREIMSAGS